MKEAKDIHKHVQKLINDPRNIIHLLYSKYGDIREDYDYLYLDALIYSKTCHLFSLYKEYLIWDYTDEFFKRKYTLSESHERLPKIASYYKNYLKFFCNPFFRDFRKNAIIQSFGDNKAEIFYKNHYTQKNKKPGKDLDNNINDEEEGEACNSSRMCENNNNELMKTLFNNSVRKVIEKNIITQNTIPLQTCQSEVSSSGNNNDFFTKRSKDESLLNLLAIFDKKSEDLFLDKINDRKIKKNLKPHEDKSRKIQNDMENNIPYLNLNSNSIKNRKESSKDTSGNNQPGRSSDNKSQTTFSETAAGKVSFCNIYKFKPWERLDEQNNANDHRGNSNSNSNNQRRSQDGTPEIKKKKSRINEFRNNKPKSNSKFGTNPQASGRFSSSRKIESNEQFIKCRKQSNISTSFIPVNCNANKADLPVEILPIDRNIIIKPPQIRCNENASESKEKQKVGKYTKISQSSLPVQSSRSKSNGSSLRRNSNEKSLYGLSLKNNSESQSKTNKANFYPSQTSRNIVPSSSMLYTSNVPANKNLKKTRNASGNLFSNSNSSLQEMYLTKSIRASKSKDKGMIQNMNNNMNMYINNNFLAPKESDSIKLTGITGLGSLKAGSVNLNLNVNLNSIHINTNSQGGNTDIGDCSRNKYQHHALHKKSTTTFSPMNFTHQIILRPPRPSNSLDEKGNGREKKIDNCVPRNDNAINGLNGTLAIKLRTKLVEILKRSGRNVIAKIHPLLDSKKIQLESESIMNPNEAKKKSKSLSKSNTKTPYDIPINPLRFTHKKVMSNDGHKKVMLNMNIPVPTPKLNAYVRFGSPQKKDERITIVIADKERKIIKK